MKTKIINVLKDDKIDDIIDIFNRTSAQEVIFVLPKRSRAFSDEDNFAALADASKELGKNVLMLSRNPEINILAAKYDFGVLEGEKKQKRKNTEAVKTEKPLEVADKKPDGEADGSETTESGLGLETGLEPEVEFESKTEQLGQEAEEAEAILTASKRSRPMSDILSSDPAESINLKINKSIERPAEIEVKRLPLKKFGQDKLEKKALDEIQNVWQRRGSVKKSIAFSVPQNNFSSRTFSGFANFFSNLSKKMIVIYGLAVVIIFGIVLYVSLGKAEITIKPRSHPLDFTIKVSASDEFTAINSETKKLPGQLLSVDKKIEETFPATGKKDVVQKARGKITVYNEYGATPQVLIATTRFESENGLIFRTLKTVTIPGAIVKNGQINPGSIEVEVIADKAGEAYNVGQGKFRIPAFREKNDTDRYSKFYGRSDEVMKGGIIGKAKVVTEQDYINAKNKVQEKLTSETTQELKNKALELTILNFFQPQMGDISSSAQIDEAVDSFVVSGTAKITTVGFKNSDLDSLLVSYIQKINDIKAIPEKLELKFENIKFNENKKMLEFDAIVKGFAYSNIDEDKLILDLIGKNEESIKEYIRTVESIASAKVVLSPFWVWKIPVDRSKIFLKIEY